MNQRAQLETAAVTCSRASGFVEDIPAAPAACRRPRDASLNPSGIKTGHSTFCEKVAAVFTTVYFSMSPFMYCFNETIFVAGDVKVHSRKMSGAEICGTSLSGAAVQFMISACLNCVSSAHEIVCGEDLDSHHRNAAFFEVWTGDDSRAIGTRCRTDDHFTPRYAAIR